MQPTSSGLLAQVLPAKGDERATTSEWTAHLACDADLRTKAPEYRALARQLVLMEEEA